MATTRSAHYVPVQRCIQGHGSSFEPASGVSVRDVAESLYIHPFMLSRWRKLAREGVTMSKGVEVDKAVAAELKALREVKRKYERLQVEHDLLKKAIAFTSARKTTSSPSSPTIKNTR